jgi:hypothetical protein
VTLTTETAVWLLVSAQTSSLENDYDDNENNNDNDKGI